MPVYFKKKYIEKNFDKTQTDRILRQTLSLYHNPISFLKKWHGDKNKIKKKLKEMKLK